MSRHVPDVTSCRVECVAAVGTGGIGSSAGAMWAAGSCMSHAVQARKRRPQSLSVGVLQVLYGRNFPTSWAGYYLVY